MNETNPNPYNGIIIINKEQGYTSFDVVAKMRGILRMKKIGHTGTLDPNATGVLPVCVGKATKAVERLMNHDKTYRAGMLLGVTTDTQDIWGEKLTETDFSDMSEDRVREVIAGFIGSYDQLPPMYSAKKVNGKKLVDLARKGIEVERTPRKVCIYDIKIEKIDLPHVEMTVRCSKGTYIRTLCSDIGEQLGSGACMESLIRIQTGDFTLDDAITLSELEKYRDEGRIEDILHEF